MLLFATLLTNEGLEMHIFDTQVSCSIYAGKPIFMYSMGGLAEYCVVPAHAVAPLAPTLPYNESAIIGCAVFTAYGAMKNAADMRAGETVAVIGTGGVGSRYL